MTDHHEQIKNPADPEIPEALDDRAADNWYGLLVVADLLDIGAEARAAAIALSAAREDEETHRVQLLRDIRQVVDDQEALSSKELVDALKNMGDASLRILA